MRALPLLAALLASACASGPSTRFLSTGQPASAVLVQTSNGRSQLLALINPYVDPAEAGFARDTVSRLSEELMIGVIAQLEAFHFFQAASPGVPQDQGREQSYVAVFLPGGSWYLTKRQDPVAFNGAIKTIAGTFNVGDRTVMTGSSAGMAPVDFRQQQEDLRRINRERMEKYR